MSVAWFTQLYRLNEARRFGEVLRTSDKYLGKRPRDYALHLQRGRALLGLGALDEAQVHLDAAVTHSASQAAWPLFYRAVLHARRGERSRSADDLRRALALDPAIAPVAAKHRSLRARPGRGATRGAARRG